MSSKIITAIVTIIVLAVLVLTGIFLYDRFQNFRYISVDETHLQQSEAVSYSEVQPILEQRCVVCHGCYDAPCQLKLTAWEGVMRGGHIDPVYNGQRMVSAELTRLFDDAHGVQQWREKGFHSVVGEKSESKEDLLSGSMMYQMLKLKADNPLPEIAILPKSFDFALDRAQQCAGVDKFGRYAAANPLAGMPYGLPGLQPSEFNTLAHWLVQGAQGPEERVVPADLQLQVAQWEAFLNGNTYKARLVSRYIFEHWFLASLYFEGDKKTHFFELVRSKTPPGKPIETIATRRPFDDPGVERVYYRLRLNNETILAKTHMPYALSAQRMARLDKLFYQTDYTVTALPSYSPEVASNPFKTFEQLPVKARYQLMLDEAQFTIMGFIKGPVCRGQVALNVINDQFWVFFVSPEFTAMEEDAAFLAEQTQHLRLPAEEESDATLLANWKTYAKSQRLYLEAKSEFMQQKAEHMHALPLQLVWDGDGHNDNAALTVFRHFDNASVIKGLSGEPPQTAWLISYSLLERIHYLLVAGFDVYGNLAHQLHTRLYMDFLRMEGEANFLSLLPQASRSLHRDEWYRGVQDYVKDYIHWEGKMRRLALDVDFVDGDAKQQVFNALEQYLAPVKNTDHGWEKAPDAIRQNLQRLQKVEGKPVSFLSQSALMYLDDASLPLEYRYYTLMNNSAYSNIAHVFLDEDRRLPAEDTITVARGIITAYPNVFIVLKPGQLANFVEKVALVDSEEAYRRLLDQYALRRTNKDFWQFSDQMHQDFKKLQPIEAGLLDYNRLENR